jgi:hypothetical protein
VTARADSVMLVDAAQVHAEGVLCGLKTALTLLARTQGAVVSVSLRKTLREWECNAIHYEWRAQQQRPVTFERDRQVRSLIAATLQLSGLSVEPHDDE